LHSGCLGRLKVVVQPVPDIKDSISRAWRCRYYCLEECRIRLLSSPFGGRSDHIGRKTEFAKNYPCACSLVSRYANPYAHLTKGGHSRPSIGIEILLRELFWLACLSAELPLGVQAEARAEVLENLAIILARDDDRTENR